MFCKNANKVAERVGSKNKKNLSKPVSLIFYLWRLWAERKRIKNKFQSEVSQLRAKISVISDETKKKHKEKIELATQLKEVEDIFASLELQTKALKQPQVVFSNEYLELLLERCESQLGIIQSIENSDLHHLTMTEQNDFSMQVDTVVQEISYLVDDEMGAVRKQLEDRLSFLTRKEQEAEEQAATELLSLDPKEILVRWFNTHLQAAQSQKVIFDLMTELRDPVLFVDLLRSIANPLIEEYDIIPLETPEQTWDFVLLICQSELDCMTGLKVEDVLPTSKNGSQNLVSLVASLFLYHPQPARLGEPRRDMFISELRLRVNEYAKRWVHVKEKTSLSLKAIGAYISGIRHIGLAIDILASRFRRRELLLQQAKTAVQLMQWKEQLYSKLLNQQINSTETKEEQPTSQKLPIAKVLDLLENTSQPMENYKAITMIISDHEVQLRTIFDNYANANVDEALNTTKNETIDFDEFSQLCADCHCFSKKFTLGKLKAIFRKSTAHADVLHQAHPAIENWKNDILEANVDPLTKQQSMTYITFVEGLVRLGVEKLKEDVSNVAERFLAFLENDVFPNACQQRADEFRSSLSNGRVQKLLETHKPSLALLYQTYCKSTLDGRTIMSFADFLTLCKDGNMINATTKEDVVQFSMAKIKGISEEKHEVETTPVSYSEFVMGMTACAMITMPDPYIPLYIKIENFFSTVLYNPPFLKLLKKAMQKRGGSEESTAKSPTRKANS